MPTEDLLKRVRPLRVVVGSKTIRIPAGGRANYNNNGRIAAVVGANPSAGPFLLSNGHRCIVQARVYIKIIILYIMM
jgi:hypothetical protein